MQQEATTVCMIPQGEWMQIKNEILSLREELKQANNQESLSQAYIESTAIPKLLGISARTWQNYRDNGRIPFAQVGRKIWVKRKDIDAFINKNAVEK